jgi:hypothetical protein
MTAEGCICRPLAALSVDLAGAAVSATEWNFVYFIIGTANSSCTKGKSDLHWNSSCDLSNEKVTPPEFPAPVSVSLPCACTHFFFLISDVLSQSTETNPYLEQIGGPESTHPEEAALGGGRPHPSDEVEHVGFGRHGLELEQLVVVGEGVVDDGSEVTVCQVRVQGSVQLGQAPAVVVQPPGVLHVKHGGTWTRTPLVSQREMAYRGSWYVHS